MGEAMRRNIDGVCFKNMVDYAVRNLNKHVKQVNRLNVFPVPDGDTGTNMVTTIQKGLKAVGEAVVDLPSVARKFARSVVFEARGNSGVIVSQFLKGVSEGFYDVDVADSAHLIEALEKGVAYAYASVATPVEGTMLTVIRDATAAVKAEHNPGQSVNEVIDAFILHAKQSLENTPELLAVLKESGVVDSGGAGIVFLFEGMKKYLDGETVDSFESQDVAQSVDYDAFNRDSTFEYGYCTEVLLQLLNNRATFNCEAFKNDLKQLGDSLVVSAENDKVRIHVHSHYPEKVFALCHQYGEFLSCKIENMTVQHTGLAKKIMCSDNKNNGVFGVVAIAGDSAIQKLFLDMGADIVICSDENVSTKDYLEAFDLCETEHIFVFPNSSDAILSAMQAKKLYHKSKITVINSRGLAECYAVLPTIDYEQTDVEQVEENITEIINNLYVVCIAQRDRHIHYRDRDISSDEYYSFSGKELVTISKSLEETAVQTIFKVLQRQEKEIITIFYKSHLGQPLMDAIVERTIEQGVTAEFFFVVADNLPCEMTISFE